MWALGSGRFGLSVALSLASWGAVCAADEAPARSELVERTGQRLVQLDVTVSGPAAAVADLGPEDFALDVGDATVTDLFVDHVCPQPDASGVVARIPTSYMLYFEQSFLAPAGRSYALELAREILPDLVGGRDRAMLVSSGRRVESFGALTGEIGPLLQALDRIENDPGHWMPFPIDEEQLVAVADPDEDDFVHWPSERTVQRLATVLGYMADVDPPKVLLYFADSMGLVRHAQAEVIRAANTHGVRIFPISGLDRAEAFSHLDRPGYSKIPRSLSPSDTLQKQVRLNAARITSRQQLNGLATATGGRPLLRQIGKDDLLERLHEDVSCVTLLSFDPGPLGLPEDRELAVRVAVKRRKVKAVTRQSIVVQSPERRLTSRLVAAFAAPETGESTVHVQPRLIPLGLEQGRYSALVQVHVAGSTIPRTTWDVGASIVARDSVRDDFSRRIKPTKAGEPVVLEKVVGFKPGAFEIVAVAHETNADETFHLIGTGRLEAAWPELTPQPALVGPIVLVQATPGAFVREGVVRGVGSLVLGDGEAVRAGRPGAFLSLVCSARRKQRQSWIVRHGLEGAAAAETPFEPDDSGCLLVQDTVPAEAWTPGRHAYTVEIVRGDESLETTSRRFAVVAP